MGSWISGRTWLVSLLIVSGCDSQPIIDAKAAVNRQLRDPKTAEFENVAECPKAKMVTGSVRAQNLFGAYTTDQFFYHPPHVYLWSDYSAPPHGDSKSAQEYFQKLIDGCYNGTPIKDLAMLKTDLGPELTFEQLRAQAAGANPP